MLRFSANLSMLFTDAPLLERFQLAKDSGFNAVEIQFPYEEKLEDLCQAKEHADVEVALINIPAGDLMTGGQGLACVPGKENEFRDAVELGLTYAKALSVPVVNVLAGRCIVNEGDSGAAAAGNLLALKSRYRDVLRENLLFAAKSFEPAGIRVLSEAINNIDMPNFLINSGQDMLDIIRDVGHENLGAQLDIYHMAMMGCDSIEFITEHLPLIGHIQFADMPGRGEPGSGDLDFDSIFAAIESSSYSGWVGAEFRPSSPISDHLFSFL